MEIAEDNIKRIMPVTTLKEFVRDFEDIEHIPTRADDSWASDGEIGMLQSVPYGSRPNEMVASFETFIHHNKCGIHDPTVFLYFLPAILANFPYYGGDISTPYLFDGLHDESLVECLLNVCEHELYMKYLREPVFDRLTFTLTQRNNLSTEIDFQISSQTDALCANGWKGFLYQGKYFIKSYYFLLEQYPEKLDNLMEYAGFEEIENVNRIMLGLEVLFSRLYMGWEPTGTKAAAQLKAVVNADALSKPEVNEVIKQSDDMQKAVKYIRQKLNEN